jgi:hypothetical protein
VLEKRITALEAEVAALKAQENTSTGITHEVSESDIKDRIVSAEERRRRAIGFDEAKKGSRTEPNQALK